MKRFGDWVVSKPLGKGGQGQVFLVRKLTSIGLKEIQKKFDNSNADFNPVITYSNDARRLFAEELFSAFTTFSDLERGALKVLHNPERAKNPETAEKRFRKEIAVLRENLHPSLVRLLDSNLEKRWFVMELHSGRLEQIRHLYERNLRGALSAIRPVIEAVSKLHERDLVHRDIKPDNIFVSDHSRLVLGDLGLVHELTSSEDRPTMTQENVGSWEWMPTWAQGMRVDEVPFAFDVFTLGKVIWWMLSGKRFLRFHYLKEPEFDLEKLFPGDPDMQTANEFLQKCVVERALDGLQDAAEMLSEVDRIMHGTSDVTTAPSPSPEEIAAENQDAAQNAELVSFINEFNPFLRRLAVEWKTRRESAPSLVEDAKLILGQAAEGLLGFCSRDMFDAYPGILEDMERELVKLQKLGQHRTQLDGGRSVDVFWDTGSAVISRLEEIAADAKLLIAA